MDNLDYVEFVVLDEESEVKLETLLNRIIGDVYVVQEDTVTGQFKFNFWATEGEIELVKELYDRESDSRIDDEYEELLNSFS